MNLSRSNMTQIPCYDMLLEEAFKYYLAKILELTFDKIINEYKIPSFLHTSEFEIAGFTRTIPLIYSSNGFYPIFKPFRKYINISNYKILISENKRLSFIKKLDKGSSVIMAYNTFDEEIHSDRRLIEIILELNTNIQVKSIFINKSLFSQNVKNALKQYVTRFKQIQFPNKNNYVILSENIIEYQPNLAVQSIMVEYHEEYSGDENDDNDIIMNLIKKYFPENTWIPYDMEERKCVFAKAFRDLEKYM